MNSPSDPPKEGECPAMTCRLYRSHQIVADGFRVAEEHHALLRATERERDELRESLRGEYHSFKEPVSTGHDNALHVENQRLWAAKNKAESRAAELEARLSEITSERRSDIEWFIGEVVAKWADKVRRSDGKGGRA